MTQDLLFFAIIPIAVMAIPMVFGMMGKKKAGVALAKSIQNFGAQQKAIKAFVREMKECMEDGKVTAEEFKRLTRAAERITD